MRTMCAPTRRLPAWNLVTYWVYVYSGVMWACVFMRTGARRVHFGEIEARRCGVAVLSRRLDEASSWRGALMPQMLGPRRYPLHQLPQPITLAGLLRPATTTAPTSTPRPLEHLS